MKQRDAIIAKIKALRRETDGRDLETAAMWDSWNDALDACIEIILEATK